MACLASEEREHALEVDINSLHGGQAFSEASYSSTHSRALTTPMMPNSPDNEVVMASKRFGPADIHAPRPLYADGGAEHLAYATAASLVHGLGPERAGAAPWASCGGVSLSEGLLQRGKLNISVVRGSPGEVAHTLLHRPSDAAKATRTFQFGTIAGAPLAAPTAVAAAPATVLPPRAEPLQALCAQRPLMAALARSPHAYRCSSSSSGVAPPIHAPSPLHAGAPTPFAAGWSPAVRTAAGLPSSRPPPPPPRGAAAIAQCSLATGTGTVAGSVWGGGHSGGLTRIAQPPAQSSALGMRGGRVAMGAVLPGALPPLLETPADSLFDEWLTEISA